MSLLGRAWRRARDVLDGGLPTPTADEERLIDQLRRELAIADDGAATMASWSAWEVALRTQLLDPRKDPRRFLRSELIALTMFVGSPSWVYRELDALRASPEWESRWRRVLVEDQAGSPGGFAGVRRRADSWSTTRTTCTDSRR